MFGGIGRSLVWLDLSSLSVIVPYSTWVFFFGRFRWRYGLSYDVMDGHLQSGVVFYICFHGEIGSGRHGQDEGHGVSTLYECSAVLEYRWTHCSLFVRRANVLLALPVWALRWSL